MKPPSRPKSTSRSRSRPRQEKEIGKGKGEEVIDVEKMLNEKKLWQRGCKATQLIGKYSSMHGNLTLTCVSEVAPLLQKGKTVQHQQHFAHMHLHFQKTCAFALQVFCGTYSCLCMLLASGLPMLSHIHVSAQGLIYIVRKLQVELHCHDLAT